MKDEIMQKRLYTRKCELNDQLDALELGLDDKGNKELLSKTIELASTLILNFNKARMNLVEETMSVMNIYDMATKLDEEKRNECYEKLAISLDNLENKFIQNGFVFGEKHKTL